MIFGVDYYPEHWNRDEWESQAKLMKEGGFNTVRMGESELHQPDFRKLPKKQKNDT